MVRSRSFYAATRSRSTQSLQSRAPYAISNAFINVNPLEVEEISDDGIADKPTGPEWPPALRTLAVKDNITTLDLPTTCASSTLKSHVSPFEATVVEILRLAGAKVQGKTNLDEFGMGSHSINSFFGPVYKDSTQRYSVGGSSGGSAIAVAGRISQFALGTDTGGSVRLPAAYTGVVGYKPSYGLISRRGVVPYANSLDTVGILAPDATHLQQILRSVRQHDNQDPTSVTSTAWERISPQAESTDLSEDEYFANLTIGFPVEYNIEELEPAIHNAWRRTLAQLRERGCKIVPVSLPSTKHALSAYYVLAPAEAASNLSKYDGVRYGTREAKSDGAEHVLYSETRGEGFGDEVKRRILLGSYTLSATAIDNYFVKAQKVRRLVQRDFDRVFKKENPLLPPQQFDISDMHESIPLQNKLGPSQVDFILCPTAPTLPSTLEDSMNQTGVGSYMNDVFTVPASLAGLPAISIPCKIFERFHKKDLSPVAGMQIIGQYGDDYRMLELSEKLDRMLNPVHQQQNLKTTEHHREDRSEQEQFKMNRALPKEAFEEPTLRFTPSRSAYPTRNTQIEIKKPGRPGPRIRNLIAEAALADNPGSKETKPLLRKHVSKRGEYHRKTLCEKEASNMLLDGFDEWLESNQGRDTQTNDMIVQQRNLVAMMDLEMAKASGKQPRGPAAAGRTTGSARNRSQKHGNDSLDLEGDIGDTNITERTYFEDIDDIASNETESISWDEAVRLSELEAFRPVPSTQIDTASSPNFVKGSPAEYEDPEEQETTQQNSDRIFDGIPQPEKTMGQHHSFTPSREQHPVHSPSDTQNSTSWNPTLPHPLHLTQQPSPPPPAPTPISASDSWTHLMAAAFPPPSTSPSNPDRPRRENNKRAAKEFREREDALKFPQADGSLTESRWSVEKSPGKYAGAARRRFSKARKAGRSRGGEGVRERI